MAFQVGVRGIMSQKIHILRDWQDKSKALSVEYLSSYIVFTEDV